MLTESLSLYVRILKSGHHNSLIHCQGRSLICRLNLYVFLWEKRTSFSNLKDHDIEKAELTHPEV